MHRAGVEQYPLPCCFTQVFDLDPDVLCMLHREQLMTRIVLCVLHFRMGARYVAADPPFTTIEMDHSDSAREACAVSTLTVLSEPCDWRGAVQVR